MVSQVERHRVERDSAMREMREGDGRDNALFAQARRIAASCTTETELMEAVLAENSKMAEPLPVAVAQAKAASAWRYKIQGKLLAPGSKVALGSQDELLQCTAYPPAFVLLAYLRCNHAAGRAEFAVVPDAIANTLSQSPMTVRRARDWLLRVGLLTLVRPSRAVGRGKATPHLYSLA